MEGEKKGEDGRREALPFLDSLNTNPILLAFLGICRN